MAYRFLLEVPDALYAEANLLITSTPDADLVDVHEGIGSDFDAEGKTITMVAYTLDVIRRIEEWYTGVRHEPVPVSIALMNGTHMVPGEVPAATIVAAIRRDQPWVERSIPKIGEHTIRTGPADSLREPVGTSRSRGVAALGEARVADVVILATDEPTDHPTMTIDGETLLHLAVVDLPLPKRAYADVFGAELLGEADRDDKGGLIWRSPDFVQGPRPGDNADFAFLQNGMLGIALERMGRGYPLDVFVNIPAPIRLLVDDASYEDIKAKVLARSWNVFDDATAGVFGFRDPFGYTWAIHSESFEKGAGTDA